MQLGWQEIMLIMIFALLVFGPKRLPEIGRQIGRFVGEVRRVSREFEQEVRDAAEPFAKEVRDAEREARATYQMDDGLSRFLPPEEDKPAEATKPPEGPTAEPPNG